MWGVILEGFMLQQVGAQIDAQVIQPVWHKRFQMNTIDKLQNYYFGYLVDNPTDMIAFLSCFIPFIFSIFYFKPCWKNFKILFYYSITILIFDLISSFYAALSKNNHHINLTFFIFEAFFLMKFYFELINNNLFRKIIILLGLIVITTILINIFNETNLVNDYSLSIQSICFITIGLISYYWILSNSNRIILKRSVLFWITTGLFIYSSGVFFVYIFISTLLNDKNKNIGDLFIIANILIAVYRIFLAIAISQTKYSQIQNNK